jgi:uncharacterized membrane protein
MEYLSVAVFAILLGVFLLYPKYAFTTKFLTHYSRLISPKPHRLTGKTKLLCAIPFLGNALLHRVTGQKIHSIVNKTVGILFCLVFIFTTIEQFLTEINPWIAFASWVALMAVYALAWISEAVLAFRMAVLLERGHVGALCLLPPLCCLLLLGAVAPYFRRNRDELSGAFEPRYLDT